MAIEGFEQRNLAAIMFTDMVGYSGLAQRDEGLARSRYVRRAKPPSGDSEEPPSVTGHRHGHRSRSLLGTFGQMKIEMPRARLNTSDGKTTEWKSRTLRAYQRRTLAADALIAGCYLAGTNTRRVRRALGALFGGAVGKDTVSRVWRKVKSDWDAWNARSLADEPIVRLILDGTVVRVRLDRKATSISLLVVIGVREDGQKVLLAFSDPNGGPGDALAPQLEQIHRRSGDVQVLMVSRGEEAANRAKVAEHGLTFPVALQRHSAVWPLGRRVLQPLVRQLSVKKRVWAVVPSG